MYNPKMSAQEFIAAVILFGFIGWAIVNLLVPKAA